PEALRAIEEVRACSAHEHHFDRRKTERGYYYFTIRQPGSYPLAAGNFYARDSARDEAIVRCRAMAPAAPVEEINDAPLLPLPEAPFAPEQAATASSGAAEYVIEDAHAGYRVTLRDERAR